MGLGYDMKGTSSEGYKLRYRCVLQSGEFLL